MSFLNQVSDQLLSSAGRSLKFGCPDIEKCLEPENESVSLNAAEVVSRDNLETVSTAPLSATINTTPSSAELNTASFSNIGQVSILDKNLDHSYHMPQKTDGALLPLLDMHISPTSKIVHTLSQLKKRNLKGWSKRLTRRTPKT